MHDKSPICVGLIFKKKIILKVTNICRPGRKPGFCEDPNAPPEFSCTHTPYEPRDSGCKDRVEPDEKEKKDQELNKLLDENDLEQEEQDERKYYLVEVKDEKYEKYEKDEKDERDEKDKKEVDGGPELDDEGHGKDLNRGGQWGK